jgi:hypothetical protein
MYEFKEAVSSRVLAAGSSNDGQYPWYPSDFVGETPGLNGRRALDDIQMVIH